MKLRAYIVALHAALFAILLAVSPAGSGSMTLMGAGKPAAAGAPFNIAQVAAPAPQTSATTSNFTVNLGAGSAGRIIVVEWASNGGTATTVAVTLATNAMTPVVQAAAGPGGRFSAMFYIVDATSNVGAAIAVTTNNAMNTNSIIVHAITGAVSSTPDSSASDTYNYNADPQLTSAALTINAAGGAIIFGQSETVGLTPGWNNATQDAITTGSGMLVASARPTTTGTLTPSVNASSQGWGMVAASWH